jgi:integrase
MGALRDRMYEYMVLRNMGKKTIQAYLYHVAELTRYHKKPPDVLDEADARKYLFHLRNERELSWPSINAAICAFKLFYGTVLQREWDVGKIPRPMGERRLPVDLSRNEIKRILDSVKHGVYRVILMTIYSGGLRVSEGAHLRVSDIDSDRMRIFVKQGKGKKDRYTLLSKVALEELRAYWRAARPDYWLFPGRHKKPIAIDGIQKAFKTAKKKPALTRMPPSIVSVTVLPPTFLRMA